MAAVPFFRVVARSDGFEARVGIKNDDDTTYVQDIMRIRIHNKFKGLTQAQIDAIVAFDVQSLFDAIDAGDLSLELP